MNYNEIRKKTRKIKIGNVWIGGDSPIAIQSMTNTDPHDVQATYAQIMSLQQAGLHIVRLAIPDMEAAKQIQFLKASGISIPIVADIHFDYRIALQCIKFGVDKIRINPGNIGSEAHVRAVCDACKERGIPIRIGVNSGSLEKEILQKYGAPTPQALCESAWHHINILEKNRFQNIVVSIKSSDVQTMIEANRLLSSRCDYPLHLGVTEAGSERIGLVKSSIGIGALLSQGIGDTIRVSLTDAPENEIKAAKAILNALEIEGQHGLNIVSCPTCGRTHINLIPIVQQFEKAVAQHGLEDVPVTVALMGCVVNGPGEAKEADFGIAGGNGEAVLFRKGEIVKKIREDEIVETLIAEVKAHRS